VIREASNGGASGRVCAKAAAKFPASKIVAAKTGVALHKDFKLIAILQKVPSFNWEFE
jgi:hypothetical protein